MNIDKARCQLKALKTAIAADGKVDWTETEVLLDFIKPYVDARNKHFVKFSQLLHKCREDGQISEEESAEIIHAIDAVSRFLKIEKDIELFLAGILAALAICLALYHIAAKLLI